MTQHPEDDALQQFIQDPEADSGIALHLAQCTACRARVAALESLKRHAEWSGLYPAGERKAQLHAIANAYEMEQDMLQASGAVNADSIPSPWLRLKDFINRWHDYRVMPVAAMAMLLALVVLPWLLLQQQGPRVVTYQDNPVVEIMPRGAVPGLGFFDASKPEQQPFEGMDVSLQGQQAVMHWPELADAVSYNLAVYVVQQGEKRLITQQQSTSPAAKVKLDEQPSGHYTWLLTGKTHSGKLFRAEGGFVIGE